MSKIYLGIPSELDDLEQDMGKIEHDHIHRGRPYPYDVGVVLTVNDGGVANTFGVYTQLVPINTYDFGDTPNRVQIIALCICSISANAAYILEFYKLIGGVYIPLGAIRFAMSAPFGRSFQLNRPCRPFNNDRSALYARLKSSVATGENVTCNLILARYIPTSYCLPTTTGAWPWG